MSLTETQRFHLKKFVKELENHRGRHTELVSVYVPSGYDLNKIINHLSQEQGTATNIKSTSTRKNVIASLEKMIQHLRLFKKTPDNGLAVFSGNVAEREGQEDFQVWSIEPPMPLNTRIYRCDKEFVLDLLRDMLDTREMYGLVVMDRRDAIIALLKGKAIVPLVKTHSEVPGKFKAGGQSAARFSRQREEANKEHTKKIAAHMKDQFLTLQNLKGILVGGPGPSKYDLVEGDVLTGDVKKKIIGVQDLSYTDEFGLEELIEKSQDILAKEGIAEEKKIVSQFLNTLSTQPNKVSYGEHETKKALQMGAVDVLLLSEELDEKVIEEFEELAKTVGTTVNLISTETREGVQLRDLGKIGALLRYPIES